MPQNQDQELPSVEWAKLLIILMNKLKSEQIVLTEDDIQDAAQYEEITVRPSTDSNSVVLEIHRRQDQGIIMVGGFNQ